MSRDRLSARQLMLFIATVALPLCYMLILQEITNDLLARGYSMGSPAFKHASFVATSRALLIGIPAILLYLAILGVVAATARSLSTVVLNEVLSLLVAVGAVRAFGAVGFWIGPVALAITTWTAHR